MDDRPAVLLLATPSSYRLAAFVRAANLLQVDVIIGVDATYPIKLAGHLPILVPFSDPSGCLAQVDSLSRAHSTLAIVAVDDSAVEIAAQASAFLGRARNLPGSESASRDKRIMRGLFADHGLPTPHWSAFALDVDTVTLASDLPYPVVIKPTRLNGSRGVIRANNQEEFVIAFHRLRALLMAEGLPLNEPVALWETFIPGFEVAVEGLLTDGALTILALFDKPDPLDGPYFEETIYTTPSRLAPEIQTEIANTTARMAAALGIRHGPVHAELRVNAQGVWPIEVACRSIGGMCSTILEFGAGASLEEIILRHALGIPIQSTSQSKSAVGVMMIPIPGAGILKAVHNIEAAKAVRGVSGIEISAPLNLPIAPLPEGASYLGFIFAEGETPADVEESLRSAHALLEIEIAAMLSLTSVPVHP